uniref:SH3 domain-containing protein n=1 Tax=Mycena chlorophos TaxID=658473 RepID=A0ABQ0LS96_MYCCL|nr:predicted protein [Mycena chlorophos]
MKPTDVPVQKHRDAEAQATMPTGVGMWRWNLGLGTLLVAFTAWIIVLTAQISLARTGTADTPAVGVLWFALALQTILILVVACSPHDASHPNAQTTALSGALLVFASLGIERHAPRASTQPASAALVAGWGLLALVDFFWLLTDGGRSSLLPAWVETIRVSRRMRSILATRNKPQANTNVARGRTISNPSAPKPAISAPSQDNQRPRAMAESYSRHRRLDVDSLLKTPPNTIKKGNSSSMSTSSTSTGSPVVQSLSFSPTSNNSPGIADRSFIFDSGSGPDDSQPLDVEELHLHPRNASLRGQRRAVYYDAGGQSRRQLSTIYDLDAEEDEEGDMGEMGTIQDEDEAEAGRDARTATEADAFPYTVRAKSSWIPRTPSEISFRQGELLQSAERSLDKTKWWRVRKSDGRVGSAPSNYLKVLV